MQYILAVIILISFSSLANEKEPIIFTEISIGKMKIYKGMEISLYQISKNFPFYRVTQEIGQGDSPDFHMFKVSTYENEELIYFISYINEQTDYEKSTVKLDEVMTCSNKVKDEFGISPSTDFNTAYYSRDKLEYGYGHMDNYIGKGNLWYLFSEYDEMGNRVTKEKALESNPKIDCISWPYARWR
jgi:hypothetical protein